MSLEAALFQAMLDNTPPGNTAFSVEPAAECADAPSCEGARWSEFYATWVRKESSETGTKRLELQARTLLAETRGLLCRDAAGARIESCQPYKGAVDGRGKSRWSVSVLATLGAAVATVESGFREDVQMGRGWAKKASGDGGRGRGPGMEACVMQPHPTIAWKFADVEPELRKRAKNGDKEAREEVMQTLLGSDEESLRRCWRTGLRMLIHAHAYCAWAAPKQQWDSATVSLFGTGTSCTSDNGGKTTQRVRLFRAMLGDVRERLATR